MRVKLLAFLTLVLTLLSISVSVSAHHGNAAYDSTRQISLKGTVTQFIWANPHCVLLFDLTDEKGQVVHWMAESENPTTMANLGWLKSSFKPGDSMTLRVIPVKNGRPIGRIVWAETADGTKLCGEPGATLPLCGEK